MSLTDAKVPPPAEMDAYDFNVKRIGPKSELTMTKCRYAEEKLISGTLDDANLFGVEVDQVLDARYRKYDFFIVNQECHSWASRPVTRVRVAPSLGTLLRVTEVPGPVSAL